MVLSVAGPVKALPIESQHGTAVSLDAESCTRASDRYPAARVSPSRQTPAVVPSAAGNSTRLPSIESPLCAVETLPKFLPPTNPGHSDEGSLTSMQANVTVPAVLLFVELEPST